MRNSGIHVILYAGRLAEQIRHYVRRQEKVDGETNRKARR